MADLLHADAIQQKLKVVLLGSPAVEVIDLLSGGLAQTKPVLLSSAQPHPCTYTSIPPAPPPASVSVVGVSEVEVFRPSHIPAVLTMELKSDEETTMLKAKTSAEYAPSPKHHHITLTLISPSVSTTPPTGSSSFPVVVVSKPAIPAEAYPELFNRPSGGKDYLCCLCPFRHSNLDCILAHVRKHLEITIGCPVSSRGYQNAASPPQTWQGC